MLFSLFKNIRAYSIRLSISNSEGACYVYSHTALTLPDNNSQLETYGLQLGKAAACKHFPLAIALLLLGAAVPPQNRLCERGLPEFGTTQGLQNAPLHCLGETSARFPLNNSLLLERISASKSANKEKKKKNPHT